MARVRGATKVLLLSLVLIVPYLGLNVFAAGPAQVVRASHNCEHYDTREYHFPYAHYDSIWYSNWWVKANGEHFHEYYNQKHANWYTKECPY